MCCAGGGWVERPVQLYRDEWGIPHVRAHSVHDAFVGQGYAHAMDRLWQMDASRKQMEGRWAEWVARPALQPTGSPGACGPAPHPIRDYQALGAEAKAMVDAYTAGVNAYLQTHPAPGRVRAAGKRAGALGGLALHSRDAAARLPDGLACGSSSGAPRRSASSALRTSSSCATTTAGADRLCIPPGADASRWIASLADLREPIRR